MDQVSVVEKPKRDPRKSTGLIAPRTVPLIYCNMPKSGCTTIKNILHRLDTGSFPEDPLEIHFRKDTLLRVNEDPDRMFERLKTDVVFTFVRHPLKRAYSCFNEKAYSQTEYSFPWLRNTLIKNFDATFEDPASLEQHRLNFKKFLRFVRQSMGPKATPKMRNPHWSSQTVCLYRSVLPWRMPDFVGRVENFSEHMAVVLGLVGLKLDFDVPKFNEGPNPPFTYEQILDDEIAELGQTIFRKDFQRFGYKL